MLPYNPLGSRFGRLLTFFLLYVTEGIPLGFSATAMTTELRNQGVGTTEISAFIALAYFPWMWKWMIGPIVDNVYSLRLGRRRLWIVVAQVLLVLGLFGASAIPITANITALSIVILLINVFSATQDVAIDALACASLSEDERGLANGLMFAGAYAGQGVGGAGALKLKALCEGHMDNPFLPTYFAVGIAILLICLFVALPMRESKEAEEEKPESITRQIRDYSVTAAKSFFGTRSAIIAFLFAIAPLGGYAMSLAIQSILAVDLGFTDDQIGNLALISTLVSAVACVLGGLLSDRIGRKKTLTIFAILTACSTLSLAGYMQQEEWIYPIDFPEEVAEVDDSAEMVADSAPDEETTPAGEASEAPEFIPPVASDRLKDAFWAICIIFAFFHGMIYGTRIALLMDVTNPAIAATQFTAYMSLGSVIVMYTAAWQAWAMETLGFPTTLAIDAVLGVLPLLLLPFIRTWHDGQPVEEMAEELAILVDPGELR